MKHKICENCEKWFYKKYGSLTEWGLRRFCTTHCANVFNNPEDFGRSREIVIMYLSNIKQKDIAKKYGITRQMVSYVVRRYLKPEIYNKIHIANKIKKPTNGN